MNTQLPADLVDKISKSFDELDVAFRKFFPQMMAACPLATCKETDRYHALYKNGQLFCYIEPQQARILFGFFRTYICDSRKIVSVSEVEFPDWNKSKGGLVGYAISGEQPEKCFGDILKLIEESYARA